MLLLHFLLNHVHPFLNTTEGCNCIITDIKFLSDFNPLMPELNAKCHAQETAIKTRAAQRGR
jgi:hypothetical protein